MTTAQWVVGLTLLIAVLAWWNARSVGKIWVEAHYAGWFWKFVVRFGAFLSAAGFMCCMVVILGFGLLYINWLGTDILELMLQGCLVVAAPNLLYGVGALGFTLWRTFFYRRKLDRLPEERQEAFAADYGDHFAEDTTGEILSGIFDFVGDMFSSSGEFGIVLVVIIVCILILFSGATLTAFIVQRNSAKEDFSSVTARLR